MLGHDAVAFLASLELFQVAVEAAGGLACQLVKAGAFAVGAVALEAELEASRRPLGTVDAVVVWAWTLVTVRASTRGRAAPRAKSGRRVRGNVVM